MAIKGLQSKQLANDSKASAPKFNFKTYEQKNSPFFNNSTDIDFVTYDGSLYVCVENGASYKSGNPTGNGFLLLVEKGKNGRQGIDGKEGPVGPMPNYSLSFDGKQMVVVEQPTGIRKAVSPDLTGPVWVPELHDKKIVWVKEESSADTRPADIDLEALRPKEERPLLLRTNSDNTKRDDETSGPANMIQWKHEGDEYWTNLISISELMNLTLAGVSFWQDPDDGNAWHFGHKEVLKATYSSDKGTTKIVEVELGEALFDAGKVPFPDNSVDLTALQIDVDELKSRLGAIEIKLSNMGNYALKSEIPTKVSQLENDVPYLSKAKADATYQPIGNYVKTVNGYGPYDNGEVTVPLKTINGTSIIGSGDITVNESTVDLSGVVKSITVDGAKKTPDGNGDISITIGNYNLFDLRVNNKVLQKQINGGTWTDVFDFSTIGGDGSGSGSGGGSSDNTDLHDLKLRVGDPSDSEKRNHLFVSYDNGANWEDIGEFIDENTILDFKTELQGYATVKMLTDNYYSKTEIENLLSGEDADLTTYRTFMIYTRNNDPDNAPSLPNDGISATWDLSEGVLVLPADYIDWTNHPENATTEKPYLWMASATFQSKNGGSRIGPWDGPFCLTGKQGATGATGANGRNGTDGADGKGVEFVYHLGELNNKPSLKLTKAHNSSGAYKNFSTGSEAKNWWGTEESTDWCPGDDSDSFWTDNPAGINDESGKHVEFACVRTSYWHSISKKTLWNDWSDPFIWSMWGEDGVDGDGVEYIFLATANDPLVPELQYPPIRLCDIYLNANGEEVTDDALISRDHPKEGYENYNTNDWVPNGWTDNPSDVDDEQPYEYVSIRRYNGTTGYWGPFSEPKKWRMLKTVINTTGETHYHPYQEFAFTRTSKDLTGYTVIGGQSYGNPLSGVQTYNSKNELDADIIWTDGIPTTSDDQIWIIGALIGDEGQQQTDKWTGPSKLGDRTGIQVEYSVDEKAEAVYLNPSLWNNNNLTLNDFQGSDETREALWESAVQDKYGVWSDNVKDPIYMATAQMDSRGVWSDWVVAKIKGEKGEKGEKGDPGDSAGGIVLDLSNEMDAIPVDKDGATLATGSFVTQIHAYLGTQDITPDDIELTVPNIDGLSASKSTDTDGNHLIQINVNKGTILSESVKIAITLWSKTEGTDQRTVNYTIVPIEAGQSNIYWLDVTPSVIKVDSDGRYSDSSITVTPNWLLDGSLQPLTGWNVIGNQLNVDYKYHVFYKIDAGPFQFYQSSINTSAIQNKVEFELRYYNRKHKASYIVMDRETVVVIKDGVDGDSAGECSPVSTFIGEWDSDKIYHGSCERTDIVKKENVYYRALSNAPEAEFIGIAVTNEAYWKKFEGNFESLATGVAFIEDLTVVKLNTAGAGGTTKRVEITNNELKMYDESNTQKLRVTGDSIDLNALPVTYSTLKTGIEDGLISDSGQTRSSKNSKTLTIGTFVTSVENSNVSLPNLKVRFVTSGINTDCDADIDEFEFYIEKINSSGSNTRVKSISGTKSFFDQFYHLTTVGETVTIDTAGEYQILCDVSYTMYVGPGPMCHDCSGSLTIAIQEISDSGDIIVFNASSGNLVSVGSNGMFVTLKNGFSAVFGQINDSSIIRLENVNCGLQLDSKGIKIKRNDGKGYVAL